MLIHEQMDEIFSALERHILNFLPPWIGMTTMSRTSLRLNLQGKSCSALSDGF